MVEQQEAVLLALVPLGSVLLSVFSGVKEGALSGLFLSLDVNESWLVDVFECDRVKVFTPLSADKLACGCCKLSTVALFFLSEEEKFSLDFDVGPSTPWHSISTSALPWTLALFPIDGALLVLMLHELGICVSVLLELLVVVLINLAL